MNVLSEPYSFQWDRGNLDKNFKKHGITNEEIEQVFSNDPKVLFSDEGHSKIEKRYGLYGQTRKGKLLSIVFTMRNNRIRVITARSISTRERKIYEEKF